MALAIVDSPVTYFPDPSQGRPVFFGSIFIGEPDKDPRILGNQKQISVRQEDGTVVEVKQPMTTSAGGVPLFDGSPVNILVDGSYSLRVLNKSGDPVYSISERSSSLDASNIEYTPSGGTVTNLNTYLQNRGAKDFKTMTAAIADTTLFNGAVIRVKSRASALFDVVLASTVTTNTFGTVQSTGDVLLAYVLRVEGNSVLVKALGALGDGIAEDQGAIRAAYSVADEVIFEAGTYIVRPDLIFRANPSDRNGAIRMFSNMRTIGIGAVTIKIVDDFSSATSPVYYNLFMSNTDDVNVYFSNIIFDLNGQNNNIALAGAAIPFGLFHTSAILWTEDPDNVGTGTFDGLIVEDCRITNVPGTNAIVAAFSTNTVKPISNNMILRNVEFDNNGFNTSDFTHVFSWCENVLIEHCKWTKHPLQQRDETGTCVEVHGSFTELRNNNCVLESGGFLIGHNTEDELTDVFVHHNAINAASTGILLFRNPNVVGSQLKRVFIHHNSINIVDAPSFNNIKIGIQATPESRSAEDVHVHHNEIEYLPAAVTSTTLGIACGSAAPIDGALIVNGLYIRDNVIKGFNDGIDHDLTGTGSTTDKLFIENNKLFDIVDQAVKLNTDSGDDSKIINVRLAGNVIDGAVNGFRINAKIDRLYFDASNDSQNVTAARNDAGSTITLEVGFISG